MIIVDQEGCKDLHLRERIVNGTPTVTNGLQNVLYKQKISTYNKHTHYETKDIVRNRMLGIHEVDNEWKTN